VSGIAPDPPAPQTAAAAAPAVPPPPAGPPAGPSGLSAAELRPVTVPILISAIANLVAGYLWLILSSCLAVFLTAPMLVLCAFEFIFFARAPQMAARDIDRRGTALGVFEIILGVFNGASFICGIVVLLNTMKLRERLGRQVL
jgi:hypothetical protein